MSKVHRGKTQHKSMRGKIIDMDLLRKKNELTPAVGNARVNARGDELGPGGKIIRKREDIIREYYENNPNAVKDDSGRAKKKSTEEQSILETLSEDEKKFFLETDEETEWVEDKEGNFTKKGKK